MGIYFIIKREFEFLARLYGFKAFDRQKSGAYYYITWTNSNVKIKILYDLWEKNPMIIYVYDADSLGTAYDVVEYKDEFALKSGSPRERVHYAAEWLKDAIADKIIQV